MSDERNMFNDVNDIRELIGQAIGAGSVCWENPAGAGVFDSAQAATVADAAYLRVQALLADNFAEEQQQPEKQEQQ